MISHPPVHAKRVLSIITVIKSPAVGFDQTYASVLREFGDCDDVEYFIKEWDGSLDLEKCSSEQHFDQKLKVRKVRGKDSGVFDAMNQCIDQVSGEWVVFLNAGDWFAKGFGANVIQAIRNSQEVDYLYFDGVTVDQNDKREFLRKAPDTLELSHFYHHVPVLHPSLIVHQSTMAKYRFDERYDLAADFDLMVRLVASGISSRHIPKVGALFLSGGLSEQMRIRARTQATRSLLSNRRSLWEGCCILLAYVKFWLLHLLIAGIVHRIPKLRKCLQTRTHGQPEGTYS